jgi:hypothetical protein
MENIVEVATMLRIIVIKEIKSVDKKKYTKED